MNLKLFFWQMLVQNALISGAALVATYCEPDPQLWRAVAVITFGCVLLSLSGLWNETHRVSR